MKLAVMLLGEQVSGHFGQSDGIHIFDIENGKIVNEAKHTAPSHGNGSMPNEVIKLGSEIVISGGMGQGAYTKLESKDIKVYLATEKTPQDAVNAYLAGNLQTGKANCSSHGHHGADHVCACIK